jgi:hypothetical protein
VIGAVAVVVVGLLVSAIVSNARKGAV